MRVSELKPKQDSKTVITQNADLDTALAPLTALDMSVLETFDHADWENAAEACLEELQDMKGPAVELWRAACYVLLGFPNDSKEELAAVQAGSPGGLASHLSLLVLFLRGVLSQQQDGDRALAVQWLTVFAAAVQEQVPAASGGSLAALKALAIRSKSQVAMLARASTNAPQTGASDASDSSPEQLWVQYKTQGGAQSDAMDELMRMTGLRRVKSEALKWFTAMNARRNRNAKDDLSFHCRFEGKPGTGKTTVAKIFGKLLFEIGVTKSDTFIECTGGQLLLKGAEEIKAKDGSLESLIKQLLNGPNAGGVLFIDEAYQLKPAKDPRGASVMDMLMELAGTEHRIVIILAGYKHDMETLFAYNAGLSRRFPYCFTFEDYTDEDLTTIFSKMVSDKNMIFDDEGRPGRIARIVGRRLGKMRQRTNFGNAGECSKLLNRAITSLDGRVGKQQLLCQTVTSATTLTRADVFGTPDAKDCSAMTALNRLYGLESVKTSLKSLMSIVREDADREWKEEPSWADDLVLNRVFLGNPGTGKTTVAKLYGGVLKSMGLLSKGDEGVVVVSPSDLIGATVGSTAQKTKEVVNKARGKVLVIDEAYGLYGGSASYGHEAIDELVASVQGEPGSDQCVIMTGYERPMTEMFENSNVGLKRRFQAQDPVRFEDFDDKVLVKLMKDKCKERKIGLPFKVCQDLKLHFGRQRLLPAFGNAGLVNTMLSEALVKLRRDRKTTLESKHLMARVPKKAEIEEILSGVVGCEPVFQQLRAIMNNVTRIRRTNPQASLSEIRQEVKLNYLFVGRPGTGKTTVAKLMARCFMELNLLGDDTLVDKTGSDLTSQYVGGTKPLTLKILDEAQGRVLFIDEAYVHPALPWRLSNHSVLVFNSPDTSHLIRPFEYSTWCAQVSACTCLQWVWPRCVGCVDWLHAIRSKGGDCHGRLRKGN